MSSSVRDELKNAGAFEVGAGVFRRVDADVRSPLSLAVYNRVMTSSYENVYARVQSTMYNESFLESTTERYS